MLNEANFTHRLFKNLYLANVRYSKSMTWTSVEF